MTREELKARARTALAGTEDSHDAPAPERPEDKGGVIKAVIARLQNATETNPVTRHELTEHIAALFPTRNVAGTVWSQLRPSRQWAERRMILRSVKIKGRPAGYWLPVGECVELGKLRKTLENEA